MKRTILMIPVILLIIFAFCFAAFAENNVIYGCYKKMGGQLRIVPRANRCLPSEVPISWNQMGLAGRPGPAGASGPQGPPGVSVQSSTLPEGDPNCPSGGSVFTSASGVTYACNGEGGGEGAGLTVRHLQTGPCASDMYGWCPDGFRKWIFRIRDVNVNENSLIAINVINPNIPWENYRACEVSTIRTREFVILCGGDTYVEPGAILNYAVFNP